MDKIFGLDSPLTRFLTKAANLMILNVLTLVCCVPVFTAGAAITAMHYVLLRMVRDEDGYIVKTYFRAFKDNFKQATAVWLFYLVLFAFFIVDIMLIRQNPDVLPHFMIYILSAAAMVLFMTVQWIFPLIMRFENPVSVNVKNAILLTENASYDSDLGGTGGCFCPFCVRVSGASDVRHFAAGLCMCMDVQPGIQKVRAGRQRGRRRG